MISAPLTAFASEDAARLVLGLSSNCPLCNNFSPFLFSTTKRNLSPLLRISIFPAINVLLVAIGIRVYVARRQEGPARRAVRFSLVQYHFESDSAFSTPCWGEKRGFPRRSNSKGTRDDWSNRSAGRKEERTGCVPRDEGRGGLSD